MFSKRTFSIVPAIADDNAQRAQLLRPDGKTVHNAAILKHDAGNIRARLAGNTEATHLVIPYRAAPHSDITPAQDRRSCHHLNHDCIIPRADQATFYQHPLAVHDIDTITVSR